MNINITVAIISLLGTVFGSIIGALSASKLVNYRLDILEKKMDNLGDILRRIDFVKYRIEEIDNYVKDNCE